MKIWTKTTLNWRNFPLLPNCCKSILEIWPIQPSLYISRHASLPDKRHKMGWNTFSRIIFHYLFGYSKLWDARFLVNGKIGVAQNSCNLIYLIRQTQDHQKKLAASGFHYTHKSMYRTRAIITRSWSETALLYKPRILGLKDEEFSFLVHKWSVI